MGALFLLVIVVYSVFGIALIVKTKGWRMKLAATTVLALLPTFDILLAQAYMHYRCSQDGGIKVYETVRLKKSELIQMADKDFKPEHWNREITSLVPGAEPKLIHGRTGYLESNPKFRRWLLPQRYELVDERRETRFGVGQGYRFYIDRTTGKKLGEMLWYGHNNSWFIGMFGFSGGLGRCPPGETADAISAFKNAVFKIVFDKN